MAKLHTRPPRHLISHLSVVHALSRNRKLYDSSLQAAIETRRRLEDRQLLLDLQLWPYLRWRETPHYLVFSFWGDWVFEQFDDLWTASDLRQTIEVLVLFLGGHRNLFVFIFCSVSSYLRHNTKSFLFFIFLLFFIMKKSILFFRFYKSNTFSRKRVLFF